jgi:hypothetical protein
MLNDVLLVCLAIGLWLALGYPAARQLGRSVIWPALAAPPLGIAILSILTVILYAWGIGLETAFKINIGLAIPGIVLAFRDGVRSRFNRLHGAFLVILVLAMFLVLLPKWLGPSEFLVFQANFADQFNYLSVAWTASQFDYPTIRNMGFDADTAIGVERIAFLIELRPGAPLMLGGFASILDQPVLIASYAYLGALQLCMLFASVFVLRNVVGLSGGFSIFVALGVTVGFPLQYAFDVNAWSAFASLPLVTLYTGLLIMGLATNGAGETNQMAGDVLGGAGFFWSILVCMAGFWYIYPEVLSLIAAISAPVALQQFFSTRNRAYFLRRLLLVVLAAGCAFALCAFAWPMTVRFFLWQAASLADPAIYDASAAWFQRYLFGYDDVPKTVSELLVLWHRSYSDFLYGGLAILTSVSAGILGLYFLQPDHISFGLRIAWRLGLLTVLGGFLGVWLWSLWCASAEPRGRMDRALFAGVLGGLVMVGALYFAGHLYGTGKALTWLSPTLIIVLIGSILSNRRNLNLVKLVAFTYIGIQICFGGYRSFAAAHSVYGVHYSFPYPLDLTTKAQYHWDYTGLQTALRQCSRVIIDLGSPVSNLNDPRPYHELFVKMALTDKGVHWGSRHPRWNSRNSRDETQMQVGGPDCIVTTELRSGLRPNHVVTWLRRDDRVRMFYRGEVNRLDLVPNVPLELDTEGLAAHESRIVGRAWTNGHAVVRVPNNPKAPIRRLTLAVGPERLLPDIHVAVLINGRRLLDEVVPRSPDGMVWTRTVELPDFGEEAWLIIEVDSDTYIYPNDTRTLGAQLHLLSLER